MFKLQTLDSLLIITMNFSSDFKLNNAFAALAEVEISTTEMCVLANWRSFCVRK